MLDHIVLTLPPAALKRAIAASAMKARSKEYSTRSCPSSSCHNAANVELIISFSFRELLVASYLSSLCEPTTLQIAFLRHLKRVKLLPGSRTGYLAHAPEPM